MKVKVKAITSFAHGKLDAHSGQEYELTKGEADELKAAGLVSYDEPAPKESKMDDGNVANKMDDEPANKNSKAKAK